MRVVPPLEITDQRLTSSTATEPLAPAAYNAGTNYAADALVSVATDFAIYRSLAGANLAHTPNISPFWWKMLGPIETAYNPATTYGLGDTVSSPTTHRVYESLAASNTGNPLPVSPETLTAKWIDVGPTNRWAMFDLYRNTKTVQASPLTVVLTPGLRVDSLGLLGLDATSVTVNVTSGGVPVYTEAANLNTREVYDWYDYFFEPFSTLPSFALFDLPPYSNAVITISIANTGGLASVSSLVIGSAQYIGVTQHEAVSDALNFSTISRDTFGDVTLVPKRAVPKVTQNIHCDKSLVNAVRNLRTSLDAKPALWSALDDPVNPFFDALLMLAIYRAMPITLGDPDCTINLELEEL